VYDIMSSYNISHTELFESVWYVVDAVNNTASFNMKYRLTSVIHEIMRSRRRLLRISKQLVKLTLMFVLVQSMEY
jgi:hypothetical protein